MRVPNIFLGLFFMIVGWSAVQVTHAESDFQLSVVKGSHARNGVTYEHPTFFQSLAGVMAPIGDSDVCFLKRLTGLYFIQNKHDGMTSKDNLLTVEQVYDLLKEDGIHVERATVLDLQRMCRDIYRRTLTTNRKVKKFLNTEYDRCNNINY